MGDSAKSKKSGNKGFFKNVKTEFNKIVWPDKNETVKQSVVVLCVSVVLGLLITFMDTLIQFGINFITGI